MDWTASTISSYDNTVHKFWINDSTSIVLNSFTLKFETTGDQGGTFTDPACAMSTFAPVFTLDLNTGTDMASYLSIDQSTGEVTFDVPTDDFTTTGTGQYAYFADYTAGSLTTTDLTIDFEVTTSCASTSFNSMATPSDMTTEAAAGTDETQQLAMTTDTESQSYGSGDGLAYCGPRESFIVDVQDSTSSTITQSFISVDQATGLITLNSATLADAGIYTVFTQQCLKYFPSICTS